MALYGIGQPVPREEDPRLLRGQGRYVDDVKAPREARAFVLRSPHAHARIVAIDTRGAKQMPGVLAVLTGDDLRARGLGTLRPMVPRKRSTGAPAYVAAQPLLAQGRVRFAGEPVAFVVADTLDQARDAAERVEIDYEALPIVATAEAALKLGAPAIWEDNPGNEAFFHEAGDKAAVDAAFARADHVVRHKIVVNRVTANSMEPRGCVGWYDPGDDRYTIRCTIQSAHGTRAALADRIFKAPHAKFRVICDNM
ncbi:MAG TPA: molybdopterin cofactor-binding domain-containing protein, partial [Stellaceae bacterium]|nr:molybdopterin cofactor-binding domain-containing protein [Stellaceae bacterium]